MSEETRPEIPLLHVFAAGFYHEPVMLVGNSLALQRLRDAVDLALSRTEGYTSRVLAAHDSDDIPHSGVFTSDGEGYDIMILRCDYDWDSPVWHRMPDHYTDVPGGHSQPPYTLREVWDLAEDKEDTEEE